MEYKNYNLFITKEEQLERIDNVIIPYAKSANFIDKIKLITDKKLFRKNKRKCYYLSSILF